MPVAAPAVTVPVQISGEALRKKGGWRGNHCARGRKAKQLEIESVTYHFRPIVTVIRGVASHCCQWLTDRSIRSSSDGSSGGSTASFFRIGERRNACSRQHAERYARERIHQKLRARRCSVANKPLCPPAFAALDLRTYESVHLACHIRPWARI